jgi:hypothetical protein
MDDQLNLSKGCKGDFVAKEKTVSNNGEGYSVPVSGYYHRFGIFRDIVSKIRVNRLKSGNYNHYNRL